MENITKQSLQLADFSNAVTALKAAKGPGPLRAVLPLQEEQEVENTMNTNTNSERQYLSNRVENTYYQHVNKLREQFNVDKSSSPQTYKELIDWIKNGKYELNEKRTKVIDTYVEDNEWYGSFTDGIKWTGRVEKDKEGFEKACVDLNKAFQNAIDIVKTLDAEAGLKALKEFEDWTFKTKRH